MKWLYSGTFSSKQEGENLLNAGCETGFEAHAGNKTN